MYRTDILFSDAAGEAYPGVQVNPSWGTELRFGMMPTLLKLQNIPDALLSSSRIRSGTFVFP
jgi:hypothetical protein